MVLSLRLERVKGLFNPNQLKNGDSVMVFSGHESDLKSKILFLVKIYFIAFMR